MNCNTGRVDLHRIHMSITIYTIIAMSLNLYHNYKTVSKTQSRWLIAIHTHYTVASRTGHYTSQRCNLVQWLYTMKSACLLAVQILYTVLHTAARQGCLEIVINSQEITWPQRGPAKTDFQSTHYYTQ
jgi:hypothetical protein